MNLTFLALNKSFVTKSFVSMAGPCYDIQGKFVGGSIVEKQLLETCNMPLVEYSRMESTY